MIAIHEVARHAGASPITMSRAINAEINVREETPRQNVRLLHKAKP